mmetsp:Transcript_38761/g.34451  ORF Transcript_38761/g.34451 Transcript_38761/m.34451 type:complete len:174 (-) Transcript_38761:1106-1627(-)
MTMVDKGRTYQCSVFLKCLFDSEYAHDWISCPNSKSVEVGNPVLDAPIFQQPEFRWILHQKGDYCAFESGAYPDHYLRKGDKDKCSLMRLNHPFEVDYARWRLKCQDDGAYYRCELLSDGSYLCASRSGSVDCTKSLGKWANFRIVLDVGRVGKTAPNFAERPDVNDHGEPNV